MTPTEKQKRNDMTKKDLDSGLTDIKISGFLSASLFRDAGGMYTVKKYDRDGCTYKMRFDSYSRAKQAFTLRGEKV